MTTTKGAPVRKPGSDMILGYTDSDGHTKTPPGVMQSSKWRVGQDVIQGLENILKQIRARRWAAPGEQTT